MQIRVASIDDQDIRFAGLGSAGRESAVYAVVGAPVWESNGALNEVPTVPLQSKAGDRSTANRISDSW
jgi:hypothetical protein